MIQRIQTIYLLLAVACGVALCFLPIGTAGPEAIITAFTATASGAPIDTGMPAWMPAVFLIMGIALRLVAVFGYKNRPNQLRTCRSALIADICLATLAGVQIWQVGKAMPATDALPHPAAALLLLAVAFTLLAMRGIRSDERLVRAADRLR